MLLGCFKNQCLFSGDNPGVGIALDGWALGEGAEGEEEEEEEESYWNHRNAAPVGSITFLEKQKTWMGWGGGGGREEGTVINVMEVRKYNIISKM